MAVDREPVTTAIAGGQALMVVGRNHANALVMAIALEQLLTEGEKARVSNDVVLQNNALLLLLEKPIQRGGDPSAAAQVDGLKQGPQLAGPIDLRHQRANGVAAPDFVRPLGPWTVASQIELWGPDLSQGPQHLGGALGAIERNQENGSAETHGANQQ